MVEASSEYSARHKAKELLKTNFEYFKIKSVTKSKGKFQSPTETPLHLLSADLSASTPKEKSSAFLEIPRPLDVSERTRVQILQKIKDEDECSEERIKRLKAGPLCDSICVGVLAFFAFLLSWHPYLANLTEAKNSKDDFDYMVEQGYSITNPYVEEYANNVRIYLEKANSFLWIPFLVFAVGAALAVFVFEYSKKRSLKKILEITKKRRS